MSITAANLQDVAALEKLINSGYRGEASKRGWTTEADLLQGDKRTDAVMLAAMMNDDTAIFLKHTGETGAITGCVYLQKQYKGLYLGMLTVSPELQGGGLGKLLLVQFAATKIDGENKITDNELQVEVNKILHSLGKTIAL